MNTKERRNYHIYDEDLLAIIRASTEPKTLAELLGRLPSTSEADSACRLWSRNLVTRDNKGRYAAVHLVLPPIEKLLRRGNRVTQKAKAR